MNTENCSQAENLVAYLYGEASEAEKKLFERHLSVCDSCLGELKAFGMVRESVVMWRDEILTSLVTQTNTQQIASTSTAENETRKRSAVAALREFFSLSPVWLRGATAFATIAFLALTVFAVVQLFGNKEEQAIIEKGTQPINASPSNTAIENDKNKNENIVVVPNETDGKEHATENKIRKKQPVKIIRNKQLLAAKREALRKKQMPRLSNSEIYDTAMYNDEDDSLRLSSMLETIND